MQAQISGDSRVYEATTSQGLLAEIRAGHPYPEISEEAFLRAWAQRMKLWDGSKISTTSTADFLADLQRCGALRVWGS